MIVRALRLPTLAFFSALSVPVLATEGAHDWLAKMVHAARQVDYEGTFVYRHEAQLDTLRIVHKVVDGVARERLVSLSGVPREVVRDEREVRCYYPDNNAVVVKPRRAGNRNFPSLLPERLQDLDDNYTIQLGKTGRVAGRATQQVLIRPRDSYRYGYRLWADHDTGILLKADLVDEGDRMLEQFMFTQISIGGDIPRAALAPQTERAGMVWRRDSAEAPAGGEIEWMAARLPKGFKLSMQLQREMPARKRPAEHLIYTDGLATVSVFVEKHAGEDSDFVQGESQMGAVNAYGAQVDGHHVTAVGEVPAATVTLIGGSVARRP
jgi:sigma-E factor negative regulatory protein RseB